MRAPGADLGSTASPASLSAMAGCARPWHEDQLGTRTAEIAAAEVPAEEAERDLRQHQAQAESGRRADAPDNAAFQEYLHKQCPALHAQHPQQRKLRAPPRHRKRLRRKGQERAGEKRHQRQHVEVHAIGPGE